MSQSRILVGQHLATGELRSLRERSSGDPGLPHSWGSSPGAGAAYKPINHGFGLGGASGGCEGWGPQSWVHCCKPRLSSCVALGKLPPRSGHPPPRLQSGDWDEECRLSRAGALEPGCSGLRPGPTPTCRVTSASHKPLSASVSSSMKWR